MRKPKLQIIVLFQNLGDHRAYYARSPAPPLAGILVAAQTPPIVDVEVLHEMIRPIDYGTDADFIALSFMDFCLPHAREVASQFQALGKKVIAGGKYPSTFPEECIPYFDATVIGEAETIWPKVVEDMVAGRLQRVYEGSYARTLEGIPAPRYDLVEKQFAVPLVTEATRGCPFNCSFCQLTVEPTPFRTRPVEDVIRDLTSTDGLPLHKRKMAMLLDNNLAGDVNYAKDLLRAIAELDLWVLGVQFSFNFLHDEEFVDLLSRAHTGMVFVGLESLNEPSLSSVHKYHNRVKEYEDLFMKLKRRGILSFTGMILALDEDTPEYYQALSANLERVDPSAILLSIAIPIPGTPMHARMESQDRIIDYDLAHYEGDHLVFQPSGVTRDDVFRAFRDINQRFYSWPAVARRWGRFLSAYLPNKSEKHRAFRAMLMSYVLLKLTRFQRHHAKRRVYPMRQDLAKL